MDNFQQVARIFRDNEAAYEVESDDSLQDAVRTLISSPEMRERLGEKAQSVVAENRGASDRTIDILQPYIPKEDPTC